jgi:hypothetical protein
MADNSPQTGQQSLRLTVPTSDPVANPNVEIRPAKLRKWVENLPSANPAKVEELLFDSLYHLNRHPGDIPERMDLMGCYRHPYNNLFDTVRKQYQKKSVVTTQRGPQKRVSMLLQITVEMAYGYKRVVNETMERLQQGKKQPHLGAAIYFAMKALTQELMLQYAEFIPDSKKTWREIFQLYGLAEQHELTDEEVEPHSTINLLFKRILLIILVDPYHLHRGEVWSCYDYLTRWGPLARLEKSDTLPKGDTGLFLLDLHSMQPPKPLPADLQLLPEQHRLLYVGALCNNIHKQLQQVQGGSKVVPEATEKLTAIQSIQMFRHMLLAWHVRPERLSPRVEKYGMHRLACGLSAASYFMGKDTVVDERDKNPFGLEEESSSLTLEGHPVTPTFAKASHYKVFEWRIFNISATGMGLIIKAPFPDEVQVGQLVVVEVAREGIEANCSVGIIRRMIQRDDDTLEVGLQFAQGKIHPIALRPQLFGMDTHADYQSGLLVEGGKKTPPTIFSPYGMFRPRQEYVVDKQWTVGRVFADKLLESTPAFDRFSFEEMKGSLAPDLKP